METTQKIETLVWNGCDGYMLWDDAQRDSDYSTNNDALYTSREAFQPFAAVEIDEASLPHDEDGELDFDGVILLSNGRAFRPA